jgi:uncharacterized protein YndB with AHSA1/START domain
MTDDNRVTVRVTHRFTASPERVFVDRRGGEDIEHTGTYLTIDRPRRLAFSLVVPKFSTAATKVIIEIVPDGTGCVLTLTHEGVWRDSAESVAGGWGSILDGVAKTVAAA